MAESQELVRDYEKECECEAFELNAFGEDRGLDTIGRKLEELDGMQAGADLGGVSEYCYGQTVGIGQPRVGGLLQQGGQWYQPGTADCVGGSVRQSCAGTRADGNESAYGMLTAKAGCLKYQQYMIPISTIISLSYE